MVALALRLFDVSTLAALLALLLAGIFLVLGLRVVAASRAPQPIELDGEKRATLREILDRGDEATAIRQVQLWFRDANPEQARRVVAELS